MPVVQEVLGEGLHADGLSQTPEVLPVRMAHLLQDVPDVSETLALLRMDNANAQAAAELVREKNAVCPMTDIAWKQLLHKLGVERTQQLAAWKNWDLQALRSILDRGDCWNLKMLAVTGKDLMEAGVPKGREVGRALEMLLQDVISERVENCKESLLERLGTR